ncbi:unnamed protein product, partial [Ectocarpus fasciculatus]
LLLPPRPVLSRGQGGGAGAGVVAGAGGGVSERPQLGVAVSPVRFNLTEPHMLGLARFAMDASARLAVVFAGPSSSSSPPQLVRSQHGENTTAVVEVDSATDEPERERLADVGGSQATEAAAESTDVGAVDVGGGCAAGSGKSDQATAVANGRGAAVPSSPPPEGDRDQSQDLDDASAVSTLPRHQVSNGPRSNNDVTLGEGERQQAGEGMAAAAAAETTRAPDTTTVAAAKAAPIPPAFLGTLIIDAISVMLLEEEDSGQRGGGGGGSATAAGAHPAGGGCPEVRINGVARMHPAPTHGAATTAAAATAAATAPATRRPRGALSPPRRRRRSGAHEERHRGTRATAIPGTRRSCYSGLVFLEVEGIGIGVDAPPPGVTAAAASAQSSPVMPTAAAVAAVVVGSAPDAQGGGGGVDQQQQQQQQCRAEFAIKRISLTDVSERRRRLGALAKLVSADGAAARPAAAAADGGAGPAAGSPGGGEEDHRRENSGGDELRVLPAGWWRQPRESGGSGDEPENGGGGYGEQVLLRARLCPVSGTATADALLASGRFMLLAAPLLDVFGAAAGVQRGLARDPACGADSGVVVASVETEEGGLGGNSGGDDGNAARVDEASTAGEVRPDETLLRASTASSPPLQEGRSCDAATDNPEEEEEDGRRDSWRWQAARALSDAGLAEMLGLRQIDVSVSAHDLQLWLPGGAPAAAVDGEAGVEAVVAACGRCHAAFSIAVGLVAESPARAVSSVARSPRAAGPATTPSRAAARGGEEKVNAADGSVSPITVRIFLDFPLAACIMTNSLGPLLSTTGSGAPASSTEASSGPAAAAAATDGAASTPPSLSHGGDGRGPGESPAGVAATPPPVPPSTASLPAATATSELAAMWTCRGRFQAAGARMKVVNNFYRQKRPAVVVKVRRAASSFSCVYFFVCGWFSVGSADVDLILTPKVPAVTGELTVSGAARSLHASVSSKIESDFYNARLMAWEPLMEPWGARVELEAGLGGAGGDARRSTGGQEPPPSGSSSADRAGRLSPPGLHGKGRRSGHDGGGGRGRQLQGLARRLSTHGAPWRQQQQQQRESTTGGLERRFASAEGARGNRSTGGSGGIFVGVRFVSEDVLNLNLTESLVENLAAIAHAQQRQGESERQGRGWTAAAAAGGAGDNAFSLHWLRNETGLPVVCSAHYREPRGGGGGGGDSLGLTDGEDDAEAAGVPVKVTAGQEAPVAASLGRPVRAVVLELEEKEGEGEEEAVAKSWRSLRPIALDVAGGQRLATMVASTAAAAASWTWAARALAAAPEDVTAAVGRKGRETVKVVTEVESYRGVKMLRIRSLVEVTNGMGGNVCLHVGLVGEEEAPGSSRRRRSRGAPRPGSRFEWETMVLPGRSCPVPATLAAAVVEGRKLLVVRPVVRRRRGSGRHDRPPPGGSPDPITGGRPDQSCGDGGFSSSAAAASSLPGGHGMRGAQAVSAAGLVTEEFEEAILILPDRDEWGLRDDATADRAASYHRTLEFAPTGPPQAGKTGPVFCGVSVARKGSAPKTGAGNGAGGKSAGGDGSGDRAAAAGGGGGAGEGAWSDTIERGDELSWLHCPPDEEASLFSLVTAAVYLEGFGWSKDFVLPLPPPPPAAAPIGGGDTALLSVLRRATERRPHRRRDRRCRRRGRGRRPAAAAAAAAAGGAVDNGPEEPLAQASARRRWRPGGRRRRWRGGGAGGEGGSSGPAVVTTEPATRVAGASAPAKRQPVVQQQPQGLGLKFLVQDADGKECEEHSGGPGGGGEGRGDDAEAPGARLSPQG